VRALVKSLARSVALLAAAPWLLSFAIRRTIMGRARAFEGSSQSLSLVPGLLGMYVRAAFYRVTMSCHPSAQIAFGTLLSKPDARIDEQVYVGPYCHLGLVHLERDVLLGPGVQIPSGQRVHGTDEADVPIRDQEGTPTLVRIGQATWIGAGAIVMADVGRDCVVGAGAVVTRPLPDRVVAGGVPARVLKQRE
jgi:acetyltransferase-like isoleucine patch superfamily enzyme